MSPFSTPHNFVFRGGFSVSFINIINPFLRPFNSEPIAVVGTNHGIGWRSSVDDEVVFRPFVPPVQVGLGRGTFAGIQDQFGRQRIGRDLEVVFEQGAFFDESPEVIAAPGRFCDEHPVHLRAAEVQAKFLVALEERPQLDVLDVLGVVLAPAARRVQLLLPSFARTADVVLARRLRRGIWLDEELTADGARERLTEAGEEAVEVRPGRRVVRLRREYDPRRRHVEIRRVHRLRTSKIVLSTDGIVEKRHGTERRTAAFALISNTNASAKH